MPGKWLIYEGGEEATLETEVHPERKPSIEAALAGLPRVTKVEWIEVPEEPKPAAPANEAETLKQEVEQIEAND
jgi:hypothetical protein